MIKKVDFCNHILNRYYEAAEGILYYTLLGYRILGINKDKYISEMASYFITIKNIKHFNIFKLIYHKIKNVLKFLFSKFC